jgi:flagellar assembly factor FliW
MKTAELTETKKPDINGQKVIQLPFGLLGFERVKNYMLLSSQQEEPFMWLQMVDNAPQAFLVVSPFLVMPEYRPDISTEDTEFLGLGSPSDAFVVNIVTLRDKGQATVNLKGPIVINRRTLIGKQVIPNNATEYTLQHPLPVS